MSKMELIGEAFTRLMARQAPGQLPTLNELLAVQAEADTVLPEPQQRREAEAEVAGALERGEVLPKLANCGHYLAEDNAGQWHYINHANTWQAYPGPMTPEARAIAHASPPAVAKGGVTEERVEAAARALASRAIARTWSGDKAKAAQVVDRGWIIYADDARAALTAAFEENKK